MLKKFFRSLGKFFQDLFKKNKKPADTTQRWSDISITLPIEISTDNIYELREETWHEFTEELKKLDSTYYPILPKRIPVKTLIVSTFTAQPYDSVGVDLSQLEQGVAHFFVTCKENMAEQAERYSMKFHEDPEEWLDLEHEGASCVIHNAVLLDYGDGRWDWYEV